MEYAPKDRHADKMGEIAALRRSLEEVLKGLGYSLVELVVSRHRGSVHVKVVIYNGEAIGTNDCTKVHRAITPRLELAFESSSLSIEVSSPGIDRLIKNGAEFACYLGKEVRCYRTDISEWTAGILTAADEKGIMLITKDENIRLDFDIIAKARLAA